MVQIREYILFDVVSNGTRMRSMLAFDYVYKLNKIPLQPQNEQNTPKTSKSPKMPTKSLNWPK